VALTFQETFSPVVKPATIRLITTLGLTSNWKLFQLCVNNAFLIGLLDEIVYMVQTLEVEKKSLVCKLNNTLFGLKTSTQAVVRWTKTYLYSV